MKAYVTKYALTKGVFSVEVEDKDMSERMITFKRSHQHCQEHMHGNNWHTSVESAFTHAEAMRVKKIASLRNQIKKLEKLEFNNLVPAASLD